MTYRTNINRIYTALYLRFGYFPRPARVKRFIRSLDTINDSPLPAATKGKLFRRRVAMFLERGE